LKLSNLDISDVRWTGGFWGDRHALVRDITTARVEEAMRQPGNGARLANLEILAGLTTGEHGGTAWSDGDCYKLLETYAQLYAVRKDPVISSKMDHWIAVLGQAQATDGYLATWNQLKKRPRYGAARDHELYNMGHLIMAACIHHRATGKESLLNIAKRAADHLYATFISPVREELLNFSFNPSQIMALVELYRTTQDQRYLELAQAFVDHRGMRPSSNPDDRAGGADCTQDRVPLRQECCAVGHAVCGHYLYCGATDVVMETGDRELSAALDRIWNDLQAHRMYVTGATGASAATNDRRSFRGDSVHEEFATKKYGLDNHLAYNETCATLAHAMWAWRRLVMTGEAKYADTIERVMYNGGLSALSTDGGSFFYTNPLSWEPSDVEAGNGITFPARRWWTAKGYCCPPQITRTIAGLHNWCYGLDDRGIYVHLYGSNRVDTQLADGSTLRFTQQTDYPWQGQVTFAIDQCPRESFAINLRIPGWADDARIALNGEPLEVAAAPGTYARVHRHWRAGDQFVLELPLRIRLMEAHPEIEADRGKVAVMRGPVVYCLEAPLAEGGEQLWKDGVHLPEDVTFTEEFRADLLGGVMVLKGNALTAAGRDAYIARNGNVRAAKPRPFAVGELYREYRPHKAIPVPDGMVPIELIPYYGWANRGPSYMEVWIPTALPAAATTSTLE